MSEIHDTVERTYDQIWNDLRDWLVSAIRDTVKCTYDQIRNIFETLASVGLVQAYPKK